MISRFKSNRSLISTSAFDLYFLGVVILVIVTGVLTEVVRFAISPAAAYFVYTLHLATILSLFLTFPYSKFAHMVYRTLALAHKRMTSLPEGGTS